MNKDPKPSVYIGYGLFASWDDSVITITITNSDGRPINHYHLEADSMNALFLYWNEINKKED